MAVLTNAGKRLLQSYATRFEHPLGTGAPAGTAFTANMFRAQLQDAGLTGLPCYWGIFLRHTYFLAGINADDGTLAEIHARANGCIVGRNAHNSATPWFTGNYIAMSAVAWPIGPAEDDVDDSATLPIPPMLMTTQAGPDYAGFTGDNRIGGWAMCLSNAAVDANEVVAIFDLTSLIAPASAGQSIIVQNQALIYAES